MTLGLAFMSMFEVCVCYLLRDSEHGPEVLLGAKKFGIGAGNLVGPGGKLEPGESPTEAVIREVFEETSMRISAPTLVGELDYPFPFKPSWSQKSWVFIAREWEGEPVESNELVPAWFATRSIPFDRMWNDAQYWLPGVLELGLSVRATFEFGEDLRTVSASDHPTFGSTRADFETLRALSRRSVDEFDSRVPPIRG